MAQTRRWCSHVIMFGTVISSKHKQTTFYGPFPFQSVQTRLVLPAYRMSGKKKEQISRLIYDELD